MHYLPLPKTYDTNNQKFDKRVIHLNVKLIQNLK